MTTGISLANKCQLLFGIAAFVILTGSLAVPWIRTDTLVDASQRQVARQWAQAWLDNRVTIDETVPGAVRMRFVPLDDSFDESAADPFVVRAVQRFRDDPSKTELFLHVGVERRYRYARAITAEQARRILDRRHISFRPQTIDPTFLDPLQAILVIDVDGAFASGQLLVNRVYIVATGMLASLLAVLVFYLILTKLILSPVRRLRETAEQVQRGDLTIRSSIATGDDFQQLSDAFNTMLDQLQAGQEQLRTMNESLDLKLNELAEANVGLFESNRLKSEFLANVSHELRTPLNSIIGFAELLDEIAREDPAADPKRVRYIGNILGSGRALLDMINELLAMAKIEAGRMEVSIAPVSVADLLEGLVAIMRPQSLARDLTVVPRVAAGLPTVETDPGKLQQILYNFLSNAIKFSSVGSTIVVSAERVTRQDSSPGVRLSVTDHGPGIPYDMQDTIFEKFRQVDASHTRTQGGTGLGLAICRELAELLGASVSLVSQPGDGATFSVELPVVHRPKALQPLIE